MLDLKGRHSYRKLTATFDELLSERSDFEAEWRDISDFLLPGRGVYNTYSKPQKRKLTSPRVVNPIAEDALTVLTSGMHGGLTSPTMPWFKLEWSDPRMNDVEPLMSWLQKCERLLHGGFHSSNFYSIINGFYTELAGFGTGSMYMGEDTFTDQVPFRFELLTVGEYAFSTGADGKINAYFRVIFMSPAQIVERFEDRVPKDLKDIVKDNRASAYVADIPVLESVLKETYMDKSYLQIFYLASQYGSGDSKGEIKPLDVRGFYEFPYPTSRWSTIGSDDYGLGPGSRALPQIKRLQELEISLLLATHKNVDPPLNVPALMKGKLNSLPGGRNYYSNPSQTVNELYRVDFNYAGVAGVIDRIESQIQRTFYNDVFLTGSRDPNATPYKATEVIARDQEKMLRLGPVVERQQSEVLQSVIERGFNIMLRKDLFPELSPELADLAKGYTVTLVSPMAVAQREAQVQTVTSFISFVGNVAQFDPEALDNVDIDMAIKSYANSTGTPLGVRRASDQVKKIRKKRAEDQAAAQQKSEALAVQEKQLQLDDTRANTANTRANTATTMVEGQQTLTETGIV